MKAPFLERIIFWICDTFGHRKSNNKNAEWEFEGEIHYTCQRCGRVVSRAK